LWGGIRVWGRQSQNLNQPPSSSSFRYLQFPIYRRYKTENGFPPPSPLREGRWEFGQTKTDSNTNCDLRDGRHSQLVLFPLPRGRPKSKQRLNSQNARSVFFVLKQRSYFFLTPSVYSLSSSFSARHYFILLSFYSSCRALFILCLFTFVFRNLCVF